MGRRVDAGGSLGWEARLGLVAAIVWFGLVVVVVVVLFEVGEMQRWQEYRYLTGVN